MALSCAAAQQSLPRLVGPSPQTATTSSNPGSFLGLRLMACRAVAPAAAELDPLACASCPVAGNDQTCLAPVPVARDLNPLSGVHVNGAAAANDAAAATGSWDAAQTLTALEVPPVVRLGPRVEHIAVPRDGELTDIISEVLQLPKNFAEGLVQFGAVHYCPISPLPPAKLGRRNSEGAAQLERARSMRALGAARHGKDPRKSMPRRVMDNIPVHQHGYLRVHVHPKRFPAAHMFDWKNRVIAEGDDWLVINKPPGVQVTPTVCNMRESCLAMAAQAIGRDQPLLITHRLDTCTEGVLVLGKCRAFVQRFNPTLARPGTLRKTYRALAQATLQPGPLVHYVSSKQRQPGDAAHTVVHEGEPPGSLRCELEVRSVSQVELTGEARCRWGSTAFEHVIELKTGRTHQIRAQFGAMGAPLLGDHLYSTEQAPADVPVAGAVPAGQGKRDVVEPIGLQAYRLEIHADAAAAFNGRTVFCAADPWWRIDESPETED